MDKDKLAQLLQASQVPNTEQVKSVTAELQKNYYSQPESLVLLIAIALADENSAVRQLAAVQAIRLVTKHWKRTSQDQKPLVRSHLLEGTLKEPTAANRHSLARLIAGIVGVDMSLGEGEDFLKELLPLNTSDNVVHREVGSFVLYAMLEDDPHNFSDHTHQLLQLFQSRIGDQSKEVRMNIVRGIGAILSIVEPEEDLEALKAMQGFVPSLVEILKANVEAGDEESYGAVFDVFHSFIAYDSSLLALHLRDLLMFMIELAGNTNAEDDPRSQALGFLIQTVRFRRMKIQAMKDVGPELMVKAMHIIVDLDSDDEEDMSPSRVAISLIDQLANELPPRQVIVPLLDQFPAFASHQDPRYRMAAMLALGNAAEGAPDFISTQLQPLLPTIINLLCDPETQVRHAALVGLIHLAEEMADEMASHHEQIIEAVLKNLESASQGDGSDKKSISIIRCACGALDTFGDGLDTKIMAQYGPNLIGPMVKLLEYEDSGVKSAAASAVGAIAASMGTDFQPYFEGVMKSLGNFVMIKDSEDAMNLRSATCDSLGRIALAVGPEAFQPYVMDLMKASEEALGLDNPRLKETSFILWSNLSKVYHEQFDHFLGGVFQGIFASLELEEEELEIPGIDPSQINDGAVVIGGKRVKVKLPETDEDAEIASGDEDWDDIDDIPDLTGVTAVAMEQEIALDVLGDVISNSCNSSNLEAYVEKTIEKVVPFTDHDYEGCRKTAISTLWRIYARVFQVWEEGAGVKWEAGMPPKPTPPASIVTIGQTLREATMTIWANDGDRSVVTDINRNIAATLKSCGPAVLVCKEGMLEEVISVVSLLLTRSHNCQLDLGEEDEEEQEVDGGSSEYDWLAIDTALEVVVGLATALGPAFGELWKIFEKPILRLASSSEDLQRSTAIGTIAEITKYAGESISPYTTSIGQALVRRLSDPDALTKSNAAYAIGLLVYVSTETQTTIPMYPQLWERLEPLLSLREMHVTDNVAGALSRMMLKNADVEFVAQALPAVVATLPLQEEYEENEPIYRAIYTLYDQSNPTVQQLTPQLLEVIEKVLSPPDDQLEPETRQLLCQTVQGLYKTNPDLLANHPGLLQLAGASP